jgi:hypothetical protein
LLSLLSFSAKITVSPRARLVLAANLGTMPETLGKSKRKPFKALQVRRMLNLKFTGLTQGF